MLVILGWTQCFGICDLGHISIYDVKDKHVHTAGQRVEVSVVFARLEDLTACQKQTDCMAVGETFRYRLFSFSVLSRFTRFTKIT